jgi:hypothetical protein
MTTYTHRYLTPTDYQVVEHLDNGFQRVVDPHNETDWIAQGNTPAKESGDRFILIDGSGTPYEDPNKAAILAAEAAAAQAEADRIAAKAQALIDNLPTWTQVDTAITNIANLADAKNFIRKLTRVVYWLAKDKVD